VNVQDLVKRHFWVIGAVTVACCAFFGGRAVAHVVEAKFLTDAAKAPKVEPAPHVKQVQAAATRSKAGKPLADRNIFCSTCLPAVAAAEPTALSSDGVPITQLPLNLIATFVAGDASMATILNTQSQAQGGYRIGSEIPGAGPVVEITYKHVDFKNNSAGGRVERVSLLDEPRVAAAEPTPTVPQPTASTGPQDEMTAAIDSGIKKLDDTTFEVDRALVDKLLANPLAASKGARVTPSIKNGKPNGIKLYAIRPSSIYSKLGLANGDTIHSINGFELDSLDKGLEVYQKVKDASSLQVSVTRRGKPVNLNYSIK
jgi:general secretion pathway protein C